MDVEVAHVSPAAVQPLRGRALWRRWTVATALGEWPGTRCRRDGSCNGGDRHAGTAPFGERLADLPPGVLAGGGALLGTLLLGSIGTAQWLVLRRHVRGAALWITGQRGRVDSRAGRLLRSDRLHRRRPARGGQHGDRRPSRARHERHVAAVTGVALVRLLDGATVDRRAHLAG